MKLLISLICIAAFGSTAFVLPRVRHAGDLLEYVLLLLVVAVLAARGWQHIRRRERQKLESMRDSALW